MSRSGFKTDIGQNLRRIHHLAHFTQRNHLTLEQSFQHFQQMNQSIARPITLSLSTNQIIGQSKIIGQSISQPSLDRAVNGSSSNLSIGIIGAGFAGLACSDELRKHGIQAPIFEAIDRIGGRCWSMGGEFGDSNRFPGQIVERGGELIDSQHHTLINYAREFGLELEDLCNEPGDSSFYFKGTHYSEAEIVEDYLDLLKSMQHDISTVSPEPTARCHTEFDQALDRINLAEYLDKHQAGDLARAYINASYQGEFGFSIEDQTCLHFLLMNLDPSLENPLEIFSDERYHIRGGNEQLIRHLTQRLTAPIHLNHRLVAIHKTSAGAIALTFDVDGKTVVNTFDAVVLTVPFPALRAVEIHENLALPDWKRNAIAQLDNGNQAKMMISFNGRPWQDHNSTGLSHSDLPHHQVTWEANPSNATKQQSTIVNLTSGNLGMSLRPDKFQVQAQEFLQDFDRIYPGANQQARRDSFGQILGHIEQWDTNPFAQGAYLCYRPGQFTQFTGLEGVAVDNLFFAGEHTHSFYKWQGFLEGAARSGIEVARRILSID